MLTEPDTMSIDEFSLDESSLGSLSSNGRQKLSLENGLFGDSDLDISDMLGASFIKSTQQRKPKHQAHSLPEEISFDLDDSLLELENHAPMQQSNIPSSHKDDLSSIFPKVARSPVGAKKEFRKTSSFNDASFISQSDHSLLNKNSIIPRIYGTPNENMLEKMKILETELHSKEHLIAQLQSKVASLETSKMEELKRIDGKIASEVSTHVRKIKSEFKKEFERKYNELKLAYAIKQSYSLSSSPPNFDSQCVNGASQGSANNDVITTGKPLSNGIHKSNAYEFGNQKHVANQPDVAMEIAPMNNVDSSASFASLWNNFKPLKSGFNHLEGFNQINDEQQRVSIRLYHDGTKISVHKDGLVEESYPGKCFYKRFACGDIRKDLPNGDIQYFFAKDGVKMVYSREKDQKIYLLKNGERRQYFADGHVEILHPDGRIEILKAPADSVKMRY